MRLYEINISAIRQEEAVTAISQPTKIYGSISGHCAATNNRAPIGDKIVGVTIVEMLSFSSSAKILSSMVPLF